MGENRRTYWVDGEIGRCEFRTHRVLKAEKTVYNTARDAFPRKKWWEWYQTSGFKEIAFIYGGCEESYRKTNRVINRLRYQAEKGTPSRTVREQAEREGSTMMAHLDQKSAQILRAHELSGDGTWEGNPARYHAYTPVSLPDEDVRQAIEVCQARVKVDCDLRENPRSYEAPEATVNISVDDVGVTRQKAERESAVQKIGETEGGAVKTPEKRKRT